MSRRLRSQWWLALFALPFLGVVAVPSAWAASGTGNPALTGVASCDTATGQQRVTWTLTNPTGTDIHIDSAVLNSTQMTVQGPIGTTTMSPATVLNNGTATGTTAVTGNGAGDLHLVVTYTLGNLDPTVDGVVTMPGGCVQATSSTTSTTLASTTSTVFYANCDAVRAAGKAPLLRGQPGYSSSLDRDGDGIACEVTAATTAAVSTPPRFTG